MNKQLSLFAYKERKLPSKRKRETKKQKEAAKRRRAVREETAPGRGITQEDRKVIYTFYGRRCMACGKSKGRIEIDHVVPLYAGGSHDPSNTQILCRRCNKLKGTRTIDYRQYKWPKEW